MTRLSQWFYKVSTIWVALACFLIFIVFSSFTLPSQSRAAELYSAGTGSPDTTFIYSGKALYHMAEVYGVDGRHAFLTARWTFDLAFPIVYTVFYLSTISWSWNKLLGSGSKWRLINILPLFAIIFDYLENTTTSLVMVVFPRHNLLAENLAPIFTPVKWFFVVSCMLLVIVGIVWRVLRKSRR
jgi:hypothetical protein